VLVFGFVSLSFAIFALFYRVFRPPTCCSRYFCGFLASCR